MQAKTYRVKIGDSLSSIAKHELGREVFWPRIYAYNTSKALPASQRLTHADRLRVGQVILLPPSEPAQSGTIAAKLRTGQPHTLQATRPAVQATTKPVSGQLPSSPSPATPSSQPQSPPGPVADASETTHVNSFPFKYDLSLIPEQKLDGGTFEATLKFQGSLVVWVDKQIPLATMTNKGLEIAAKTETDSIVVKLLTQSKVSWDRSANKVSFEDLMTTQAKGFPPNAIAVGIAADSLNPVPAFRAKFTSEKLEGRVGQALYIAQNLTITVDLRPKKDDDDITRRPNAAPAVHPGWLSSAVQSVERHGNQIAAGALVLGAGVLIGAAVASNFVTFGLDTPADVPAGLGAAAMLRTAGALVQ